MVWHDCYVKWMISVFVPSICYYISSMCWMDSSNTIHIKCSSSVVDPEFYNGADGSGGPQNFFLNFYLKRWVLMHSRYLYAKLAKVNGGQTDPPESATALVKHFKVLQAAKASALYSAVNYSSNQVLSTKQVLLNSSLKCWLKCCTFQHLQSVIVAAALPSAVVALKRVVIFRALLSAM